MSATITVDAVDTQARKRADAACEAATNTNRYASGLHARVDAWDARLDALAELVSQVAKRTQPAEPTPHDRARAGFAVERALDARIRSVEAERDAARAKLNRVEMQARAWQPTGREDELATKIVRILEGRE